MLLQVQGQNALLRFTDYSNSRFYFKFSYYNILKRQKLDNFMDKPGIDTLRGGGDYLDQNERIELLINVDSKGAQVTTWNANY